jgi:hypothetical protein
MINWIKARLRERTTYMGLVAAALAASLLVIPLVAPADAAMHLSDNVKWLIGALFVGGLGGVIWKEKP